MLTVVLAATALASDCDLADGAWLLTMDPGDDVQTIFGHTGVLVYDSAQGDYSPVYDYGRFEVDPLPTMAWEVLTMTKEYYVASRSLGDVRSSYDAMGRGVTAQQLLLDEAELQTLSAALSRDLNGDLVFDYNWYRPNCTTMVLDRIDDAVGGTVRAQLSGRTGISPAGEVLRHSAPHLPLWLGLHWGSGRLARRPVDHYSASFLPDRLRSNLEAVRHPADRPLLGPRCTLASVTPVGVAGDGPNRDPWLVLLGALWAGLIGGVGRVAPAGGLGLVAVHGVVTGLWGSAALLVGVLGTFAPFWGHHNLAIASPLSLALVAAAGWRAKRPSARGPMYVALGLLGLLAVGVGAALLLSGLADRHLGLAGSMVPPLTACAYALRPRPPAVR